jgi:hypothetical protein
VAGDPLLLHNVAGSNLVLTTLPPAPTGMRRSAPQHEIQDTDAWTLSDVLLQVPGLIQRRGPLTQYDTQSGRSIGMARTQAPDGTEQQVHLVRTGTPAGKLYGITPASWNYSWPVTPVYSPRYTLFRSADALLGGVFIGTGDDLSTNRTLGFWHGGSKGDTGTLNLASSIARGDTTVSLSSGGSSCSSGMFVFNSSGYLVGTIKSVSGNTLTLRAPSLVSGSSTVTASSIRGVNPRVTKGAITCATTATVVNGADTKFADQGLATGTWDIFTSDFTYVGTVASVTSNTQLTLASSAAVSLLSSDYIAINRTGSYSLTNDVLGFITAEYAGHQFYAQGNSVFFSDTTDREGVDTTIDGDYLQFSSDPVRALQPTLNALVSLTETEAYALVGAVGTTPDRWRGERIHDDGTLCTMSVVGYKGGAIWAGKRGIWYWDGSSPVNIVDSLGDAYRLFVSNTQRCYGMIARDHYFLFVEDGTSGVFSETRGSSGSDVTTNFVRLTIAVNLTTGAVTILKNVELRGFVELPASVAAGTTLASLTSSTPNAVIWKPDALFDTDGNESIQCEGAAATGPSAYVETKKYGMGDGQRLKLFKMLLLHYRADGGVVNLDTVKGLNSSGEHATSTYSATSGVFSDARIKFMKRSQFLAFRFYEGSGVTHLAFGPWAIAFKWKRPGRV